MRRGYLLGFGGMVGLGVAVALIITVIAIGRDLGRQLTGAMAVVITFAEVAICTVLAVGAVFVVGLVLYRGQLARIHVAEKRIGLEQLVRGTETVRAEVLGAAPEVAALPQAETPAIQGTRPVPAAYRPHGTGGIR